MTTIWAQVQRRLRSSPGTPLVTFVDDSTGVRTELSATSLENAAAKIANALRDEYGLEPGALVSLRLAAHWQRAAWCAGAWTARCVQFLDDSARPDLIVTDLAGAAHAAGSGSAPVAVVSLHPFGLPISDPIPSPAHDATIVVRQQPDAFLFEPPLDADVAIRLADGTELTQSEVTLRARDLAADWSLGEGGRLLVLDAPASLEGWLACLAVPLSANGSVVIGRNVKDVAALARSEGVTATASL